MLPIRRSGRQKVNVGRCLTGMMALLAVSSILISNVLLHRSIDESAGLNWAAIHRLEDPKLTESLTIRQRYGLFFALRARVSDRTILEIPTGWRGSDQERQFEDFFSPVLAGVSQLREVNAVDSVPYGTAEEWFEPSLKQLRKAGLNVDEGRSRANGRNPWYSWRVVTASKNPAVLQVLASPENNFVLIEPTVTLP